MVKQFNNAAHTWLYQELPREFQDLEKINERRLNLIKRHVVDDVPITQDNHILLVVVLDSHVDDWDLKYMTSIEVYEGINAVLKDGANEHIKAFPIFITCDLGCISNVMINSVSDVIVAYPIYDSDDEHYNYISLIKELNNEEDCFFDREIRYGHNMQNLIRGTFADLWPRRLTHGHTTNE